MNTTAGEAGVDPGSASTGHSCHQGKPTRCPDGPVHAGITFDTAAPTCDTRFVDEKAESYWLRDGVDLYIGGAEHAVLHLLYARFWNKMLHDLGYVSSEEPFRRLFPPGPAHKLGVSSEVTGRSFPSTKSRKRDSDVSSSKRPPAKPVKQNHRQDEQVTEKRHQSR